MPWFCSNCGERMNGRMCGGRWRYKGKYVRCNCKYGMSLAERIPPIIGIIYINDDGTGITRPDQNKYDSYVCKAGKYPRLSHGPRPNGWEEALEVISERAYKIMQGFTGYLPDC